MSAVPESRRAQTQAGPVSHEVVDSPRGVDGGRPPSPGSDDAGVGASLARIEKRLEEIRGLLNAQVRERQHREFSAALLVGVVVQIVAGGLIGMALLDWIFQAPTASLAVKLGFAAVFQLVALTALALWRMRDSR